jgi:putative two-component system response regulator
MSDDPIKNARIFVVDDDPASVEVLELILKDAGYTSLSMITDSRQAISMFRSGDPDLVLLDLHMPHQDGYEVLRTMRYLVPADAFVPIIVLTADVTLEARRRTLASGATDFLSKPFDTIEIGLRIENMLRMRFLHRELQNEKVLLEKRVRERTRSLERLIAELRCASLPLFATRP